ncbi:heavy metal-associated isoprenylated plant protein 41-like, partial [Mercurialis annua]|uniref:heavy metal-associated isoprenylated plant protein 41-like n=1 Tax=Mercurialis annua TaxID=3986 RepID=UPI0021602047
SGSNLEKLLKLGASVFHGVDATNMKLHSDLQMLKFDRIIFNFPHAGFHGKEDNAVLIEMHQQLVLGFFRNASEMLRAFGEVHVTHKTSAPYSRWNIVQLGLECSLFLVECVDFKKEEYPGYHNKRGDGTKCDRSFRLGPCSIFKFF